MNGFIGGFITIITYGGYGEGEEQAKTLLTENNFDVLTEAGQELDVEN